MRTTATLALVAVGLTACGGWRPEFRPLPLAQLVVVPAPAPWGPVVVQPAGGGPPVELSMAGVAPANVGSSEPGR